MAVLVTGGAGYIGGHMALALADRGEDVVVLDNLSTGFDWAVPPSATLVVGDMGDAELVGRTIRKHGVDAIAQGVHEGEGGADLGVGGEFLNGDYGIGHGDSLT